MKTPRAILILLGLAAATAMLPASPALALLALALVVMVLRPPTARLCVTLTVAEILADVLDAFKTRLVALGFFCTDFSAAQAMFGQQIIAHLPTVPTAYDHDGTNGYAANAQSARNLLQDVPITIDKHKDVPIVLRATDISQDRSRNYLKTINNAGYTLVKSVVDYALSKALAANFSTTLTVALTDVSKDTLTGGLELLNANKAGTPRFGIVSTPMMSKLTDDSRIANRNYFGQLTEDDPYRSLVNIEGFKEVKEYADFPNNGENLIGLFFDTRAFGVATRLPVDSSELAAELGIPVTYRTEVVQDEETGLAVVAFYWVDNNTHDIFITFSLMFGAVAGKQGGADGTKTDLAAVRVITA